MRVTYVCFALLSLVVLGCSRSSTTPTRPATTGPVTVVISQEQMDVIKSLPEDVVCLTSARNPVTSLVGIGDDEFAAWPTSPDIPQKLMAAFGRKDTIVGLSIMAAAHKEADFD